MKKFLLLGVGLLLFWLLLNTVFTNNLGSQIRFFNDSFDRKDYARDASWYLTGKLPYKDVPSEYPQIPTYLFAVPFLVAHFHWGAGFDQHLYNLIFSFMMLAFLFGTISLLYRMLPSRKNLAFLMLLPAPLFFSYNRFDILPSFLVLLSLFLLQKNRFILSAIVLGIATLTKWYPGLLFPAYLVYIWRSQHRLEWKMVLAFGLTCVLILLPTYLTGGIKAVLEPYIHHAERAFTFVSIPELLQRALPSLFKKPHVFTAVKYIFIGLQLILVPITLFIKIETFEKLVRWCLAIVAAFVLFSTIWSPQWILWILPLAILVSRSKLDVFWLSSYAVVNYLSFPLTFDIFGPASWLLIVVGVIGFIFISRYVIVEIQSDKQLTKTIQLP